MTLRRLLLAAAAAALLAPAPASAAALIAAYDRYESGKGFQIGLVNVSTGASMSLPAAVNTAADELHPSLSKDGRFLYFARLQLQPTLSGEIVPPAERRLFVLDRNSGTVQQIGSGTDVGLGVTYSDFGRPGIAFGKRPTPRTDSSNLEYGLSRVIDPSTGLPTSDSLGRVALTEPAFVAGDIVETTQAVFEWKATSIGRSFVAATSFGAAGDYIASEMRISSFGSGARTVELTDSVSHPTPRPGDGHIAFQSKYGAFGQIMSFTFPTLPATAAPAPVNSASPESMPAWSPDLGKYLGFVRVTNGRRTLLAFDTTPGIQDALNAPIDIGAVAPTSQLRRYHEIFGGLSLALSNAIAVPNLTCSTCISTTSTSLLLEPSVTSSSLIGILVARVRGTRTLLGRKVPKITPVGRVPLGKTKKGRNRFKWDGRVEGKRLKKGRYVLTFRALNAKERILNTSGSIRFKANRKGELSAFTRVR